MIGALSLPALTICILVGVTICGWLIYKPGSQTIEDRADAEPPRKRLR